MNWRDELTKWTNAVKPHTDDPPELRIDGPATEADVQSMEKELKGPVPAPLRAFLRSEASAIQFWWFLEDEKSAIDEVECACSGSMEFDLQTIVNEGEGHAMWLSEDESDELLRFRRAFPFLPVGNGDAIALDLMESDSNPPVIYLNHEVPSEHIRLGESLTSFLEAWFRLGCVGPEIWTLRKFMTDKGNQLPEGTDGSPTSRLDADCPRAMQFKSFFGLA